MIMQNGYRLGLGFRVYFLLLLVKLNGMVSNTKI